MFRVHNLVGCLLAATFLIVASSRELAAEEYVWARASGISPSAGYMTNGYGSYYVPKSLVENSQDGQPTKNPGGFIVPSKQPKTKSQTSRPLWKRLTFRRDRSEPASK